MTTNNVSIRAFKNILPTLAETAFVDQSAVVIGDVTLAKDVSVWPLTVIRGDVNFVRIGERSNIQDGSVIHETRATSNNPQGYPVIIGDDVTVGHKVMLHGCTIGNKVLIGMGAIVLDGAVIEDEVVLGAGSLVAPGKTLESGHLYIGSPARQARPLTSAERAFFTTSANNYVELKNHYLP
jgi:carbonic anhydrase/acetyltransferase-like protein (isoleucine patch superfamily)